MSSTASDAFLELVESLEKDTHTFDLFALLRRIDALNKNNLPLGRAPRPRNEPIRLGQKPSSSFAPSALADLERNRDSQPAKLTIHGFGLFGPNGPMPLVMTEYVRERSELHGDKALAEFFDLFHHRLISLFYRAWAEAQSTNSLDRPDTDSFSRYVSSLLGLQGRSIVSRPGSVPHHAYLSQAGHLARQVRNAEGLARIIASYFQVEVNVCEFASRWLRISEDQQTRLTGFQGCQLGVDTIAGRRVLDRQHHFKIVLGPLTLAQYSSFLPGGAGNRQLSDWISTYVGIEFSWEVSLILQANEVPTCQLGGPQQLGWLTWVGDSGKKDRSDLTLYPEPCPE
ncbi:type VI secretion system baseplate subunit TssG [Halopseudomonas salegens]|uniref:Type VI secretion system protein ImpH n=1 Tax=Halopseudomonas salegens TaxID=1434072 RepID=A0A1H2E0J3_9GAMM|nr:type VI secretion system baseplate subunit TssG [Halopseudomonas salegens]SDT88621.1 type VI secretion system protein ImpH [Halopseudomonas salegens]